jgi:hypothetical protein
MKYMKCQAGIWCILLTTLPISATIADSIASQIPLQTLPVPLGQVTIRVEHDLGSTSPVKLDPLKFTLDTVEFKLDPGHLTMDPLEIRMQPETLRLGASILFIAAGLASAAFFIYKGKSHLETSITLALFAGAVALLKFGII